MRVMLFLLTNVSVMVLFGSIVSLLGCCVISNNIKLMSIAGIIGLGGACISLLLSKSIALSAVRGKIINIASNDMERWLLQTIRNYAGKLNIVTPQLAIYISSDMNAFATGSRQNDSLIAISSGLLKKMHRESIEAVIAHEINHIVSGDMITMTLIQGIVSTFVIFISRNLANFIYYWISWTHDEEYEKFVHDNDCNNNVDSSWIYMIVSLVLELFFSGIASIIVFWFSRYREFYADAGAAKLVGCDKMISALQTLKCDCKCEVTNNSSIATLFINNVAYNRKSVFLLYDLFSSHPSLDNRIQALKSGLYYKSSYFF